MAEIKYTHKDHIITLQKQNEEAFLAEFAAGDYTLTNPLVKLNPYIICPLSAMILFKTPRAEEVTIIVHGKEAAGDICHTFPAAYEHILPIYGLYADYDNQVEIVLQDGSRHTVTSRLNQRWKAYLNPLLATPPQNTWVTTWYSLPLPCVPSLWVMTTRVIFVGTA